MKKLNFPKIKLLKNPQYKIADKEVEKIFSKIKYIKFNKIELNKPNLQVKVIIHQSIDKMLILKDQRILILFYNNDNTIILVLNKKTYKKEIEFRILNTKINDLIILSNGNLVISYNKCVQIYKINKKDLKLIQEIKINIEESKQFEEFNYYNEFLFQKPKFGFSEAKCGEYKNGQYLVILKLITYDISKYGIYNYCSKFDIYSLTEKNNYSYIKSTGSIYIEGHILYNNKYIILHGVHGANPMSTRYEIYSYDIENEKTIDLNCVRFFNEKHEFFFLSKNKLLHYYKESFDFFIFVYDLEKNEKILETNLGETKIKYICNNEQYIYFLFNSTKKKEYEQEEQEEQEDNNLDKLIFYKYDYNMKLIEEYKYYIILQLRILKM